MPWGSMGTIWAEMGLDYSGLARGIDESGRLIDEFDRESNARFKAISQSLSRDMQRLGRDLTLYVSTPLSVFGGLAAKGFAEFEASMANVWTLLDVGKDSIQGMTKEVEALSKRVPQTATQLADGLYQVISASVPAENAMYVLETAAKAASAGLSDTYTSVDAITTVLNAYGMEAEKAGWVSDVMFKTVERGKINFQQLASTMGQVISTAAEAGVSFEEVAGAYSMLTRNGVQAERSATGIAYAIRSIVAPTESAQKAAEQYGITLGEQELASKGFVGVLREIYDATGGSQEALARLMGSIEGARAVTVLARGAAEEYTQDVKAMADAAGSAEKAFGKQVETNAAQAQLFKNEVSALTRAVGEELWPVLNEGMAILKPLIENFTNLPKPVKESAVGFGLVAVAAGPLVAGVGALISVLSGPAGLIIALAAVVAGITGWVRASQDLEGKIERQVNSARRAIDGALRQADAYGKQVDELDRLIKEYEELQGKPDKSQEEHERLRKVIDDIVQLCPQAATGYDEMGRALMDNAENAKRYKDELQDLYEQQLEIAARRAEFELPALRLKVEELKPQFEKLQAEYDALYEKQKIGIELLERYNQVETEMSDAISKKDRERVIELENVQQAILKEAVAQGIMYSTMEPLGARVFNIVSHYQRLEESLIKVGGAYRKAREGVRELEDAEQRLEDFRTKKSGGTSKPESGTGTTGKDEKPKPPPLPTPEELSEFEELGIKIKALSNETYKDLRDSWVKIEEGLKSKDIVERIYAEDQAGKLSKYLKSKIYEFGGNFEKAAAAAAEYIKNGWQEIDQAADMDRDISKFRAKVSIEGLGVEKQISGLEEIKAKYQEFGVDMTQIDVQLAELRRQQQKENERSTEQSRQKSIQEAKEEYGFYAQLYDYDAQNHIDHLNRLLQNEQLSADERKKLEQELELWKKAKREEDLKAQQAAYDLLNSMGLIPLQEQIAHQQKLVDSTKTGTADRTKAVQDYYAFLMSIIATATKEELESIETTLQAQLAKYEAEGEGASQAAMTIQAALDEINRIQNRQSWIEPWEQVSIVLDSLANKLDSTGTAWGRFASAAIKSIQLIENESTGLLDIFASWEASFKSFNKLLNQMGLQGMGSSIGNILSGQGGWGDIGSIVGGIFGGGIGSIVGGLLGGLFDTNAPPSASMSVSNVEQLSREFAEYRAGGEGYYKNWWDQFWNIQSRDMAKTMNDIAGILGTTVDDIASSLSKAFSADTYEDFVDDFGNSLEQQTMKALISAFMASNTMKPLLDNLSSTITKAAMDAQLTDEEKAQIRRQISAITDAAKPFYDMLREMFPELYDEAGSGTGSGGSSGSRGTQISEITGPTRDLLIETLRPITVLDSLPGYFLSMERAIYDMRDAFIAYNKETAVVSSGTASVINEYHIQQITINAKDDENFDDIMESLGKRAQTALIGSGA